MSYINAEKSKDEILIWERDENGRHLIRAKAPYFFYSIDPDGEYTSMYGDKLTRHDFKTSKEFYLAIGKHKANREKLFESDIPSEIRYLSEHYYNKPAPKLNISFYDIEVDYDPIVGFSRVSNPYAPINSIALYHTWKREYLIFAIPPNFAERDPNEDDWTPGLAPPEFLDKMHEIASFPDDITLEVRFCKNEKELLSYFLESIQESDLLAGWNSDIFDNPYITKRIERLGKSYMRLLSFPEAKAPRYHWVKRYEVEEEVVDWGGRIPTDYLELFKKYEMTERPSYKLESIADEMLPHLPKLEYEGTLATLYRKNFPWFVRYNIRDTEILQGLEERLGYVELGNQMMHLSTGTWKSVMGTIKLAEYSVINYCHHELGGLVVNDFTKTNDTHKIQGAFVLLPQKGLQEGIGSIDINSLYPSSIRAINISPETLMGQFDEKELAIKEIAKNSDMVLSCRFDNATQVPKSVRGKTLRYKASEWRAQFKDLKWAVSGYGTVFDQTKQGVIPKILEDWYATRKKYQKLKGEATSKIKKTYYDKLQYTYKIKLNAFYGALNNIFFRFFDLRMGESTTGTGRMILLHQCAETCKWLDGKYMMPNTSETEIDKKTGKEKIHIGYTTDTSVIYGDSVSGNSIIEIPSGTCKIEDLFTTVDYIKGTKEYCNVNEKALTFVPDTNKNEYRPIKYVVRHKINKKMYRIWFGNTRFLDVTEDHSLIGYANTKSSNPGLIEVKPTEIGKNNVNSLLLNSHILPSYIDNAPKNISPEMYMLMGLIIGDGYVGKNKNGGVELSIEMQDKDIIINTVINPLIEQGWFTSFHEKKNKHDIRLCGVRGWKFLKQHLYQFDKKDFPIWLETTKIENIQNVLSGYFSADGTVLNNGTIRITSINSKFIKYTNRLLKICGIGSNYWTETTENTYNEKPSNTYSKQLVVYNAIKFGKEIGFIQNRKQNRIRTKFSTKTEHMKNQNAYVLISPTKIEMINHNDYVYDIEVDDTHMFYANDILVHNTDSTYFKTHGNSPEEMIQVGDIIGRKVNNSFQKYMQETFLCTPSFDDKIKCARENISDRGIFVDKKMYILHIIDSEGEKVDKMKVMGLSTKKTTLPKEIANTLNKFIERFLKGEDWENIEYEIVDYKDSLINQKDIMKIGLPTGIKKVEAYQIEYDINPNTNLPGHIAAAIHYNKCLKEYNDNVSMEIMSGTKIKVFYLMQKQGRFKSIAIPVDIEEIPEWFLSNPEFEVNKKAHIERLVDKPLTNILRAIGKKPPSKQQLLANELLIF